MKRTLPTLLVAVTLAACGGGGGGSDGGTATDSGTSGTTGGTTDGGTSSSSGSTNGGLPSTVNVTIASVGVHPAAVAALSAKGIRPPSFIGYDVVLQGVSLGATGAVITTLDAQSITAANQNQPFVFNNVPVGEITDAGIPCCSLGLISALVPPPLPDGGSATGTLTWPADCSALDGGTVDGGYSWDTFITAGSQIHFERPSVDVTGGASFALPMSYVTMLDCAAGQKPGTLYNSGGSSPSGFALLYASQSAAGQGSAIAGVSFTASSLSPVYYAADYSSTASAQTTANGVATITGAPSNIATATASGGPGNFPSRELSTPPDSAYQVFYCPNCAQ